MSCGFSTAKLGRGGGYLGSAFDVLLSNGLGRAGEVVVLVAWSLICLLFIINIPLSELAHHISTLFASLKGLQMASAERRPAYDFGKPKAYRVKREPKVELPDGFNPLSTEDVIRPAAAAAVDPRAHLAAAKTPVRDQAEAQAVTTPIVRRGVTTPVIPWPIPAVADILDPSSPTAVQSHYDKDRARIIEETLASFGAPSHIVEIHRGPAVTQYGVEPDFIETRTGRTRVRVARIVSLADDLAALRSASAELEPWVERILAAQVTERLSPGTVHSYESCSDYLPLGDPGYSPDRAGCINLLTSKRFITPTSTGTACNPW